MITSLTRYAGFWRRALALFVDILWIVPLLLFISYMLYGSHEINSGTLPIEWQSLFLKHFWQTFLINEVLPALLIILFWISYGATPGKFLLDCKVVDAQTGKPITPKQALLRYLGYYLSAFVFFLGFLWVLWDKRQQGWHDKIACTVVVIHDEATIPLHQLESYH